MKSAARILVTLSLLGWLLPTAATAELSRTDRKAIKKSLKDGILYLRTDAPCITGRHDFGTFVKPLVTVSPRDLSIADGQTLHVGFFHTSSTYLGIRINDPVEFDEMDYDDDDATLEIEVEGVEEADGERTIVLFVDIHTMEDFQQAFDRTFSRRPLQEHHDDWSPEIKTAIADRHLLDGMSKRQAFYITGEPQHVEQEEKDGKTYETWLLRTDRGLKSGFVMTRRKYSRLPGKIYFVDGKLVGTERPAGSLHLDD